MNTLFLVFLKIVVAVAIGFLLRKHRVLDERMQKGLSDMLLRAILPFSILASANYPKSDDVFRGMIAAFIAAVIYYSVSLVILRAISKKLPFQDNEKRVFVTMTTFANTSFVGFPVMSALYGDHGLLLAVVFNMAYNIFMYTYGVHLLSGKSGDWKEVFLNPVTISSVVAIAIFVSPWTLPVYVSDPITLISNMTVPLSMIIIGSNLATLPFQKVLSDPKSYLVSLMRLLIIPGSVMLCVFLLYKMFPMLPTTASVIVLMCALPCGSMNVILSEKYNCAPDYAARATVQSMILTLITLPLMVFFCMKMFV
ncbi:MAG: AEC family transporter [Clostridiales bacterium]|nr:AEC family transporter [Clostridiales bacterium]